MVEWMGFFECLNSRTMLGGLVLELSYINEMVSQTTPREWRPSLQCSRGAQFTS
jgi:hypothetical protein